VTQQKSSERLSATEAINKKLFILLNSFDILVCIFLSGILVLKFLDNQEIMVYDRILKSIFIAAVQCTGFTTSLLAVIRAISVIWPLHQVITPFVIVASMSFALIEITLQLQPNENANTTAQFFISTLLFVTVVSANILCIIALVSTKLSPWKKDATVTMGILSVLYCTMNIGFLVMMGFHVFKCHFIKNSYCSNFVFEATSLFILFPLNSACNPIVYFVRNADMRKYLIRVWRRVIRPCRSSR
jgi:hypothetical protein